jgi:DNA-directed RNA polymerase subunit omega
MLDIDAEEALIRKVGGKFALTVLLQKRMVELNRGAAPLVKLEGENRSLRRIVCQEILEDKLILTLPDEAGYAMAQEKARLESTAAAVVAPPPAQEETAEIYGSDIKRIKEARIKELAQMLNPKKA